MSLSAGVRQVTRWRWGWRNVLPHSYFTDSEKNETSRAQFEVRRAVAELDGQITHTQRGERGWKWKRAGYFTEQLSRRVRGQKKAATKKVAVTSPLRSPPCEPCSHSPRSSIHRLTYTPTPPCHCTGFEETLTLAENRDSPFPFHVPPLRPSSLVSWLFSPLPSSVFNLSHSHVAHSPPTLLPASSPCQVAALNTPHTFSQCTSFSFSLDFSVLSLISFDL